MRDNAAVGTFESPAGTQEALTVVILVGVWNGLIDIQEIVLTATGPCTQSTIGEIPVAIAPNVARTEFTEAVNRAAKETDPGEAAKAMVAAVQRVAEVCPEQVSARADVVAVYLDGSSVFQTFDAPKIEIPRH